MKEAGELDGLDPHAALQAVVAKALPKWAEEAEDTKAEYETRATKCRDEATTTAPLRHDVQEEEEGAQPEGSCGPLGFAALDGQFPALPMMVEEYQDANNFAKSVQRFCKNRGFYTQPMEGFPETVHEERTCRGGPSGCSKEVFAEISTDGCSLKPDGDWILEYIRLVLQHAHATRSGPAKISDPTVLIKFCPCDVDNFEPLY